MSAKKVTISISDGLAERAEKWKDKYSPSELYQQALEDFVSKKEQLDERLKGEPEMEAQIIERLKAQRKAVEINHLENGRRAGLAWAQKADYPEFKYAATSFSPFSGHGKGRDNMPVYDAYGGVTAQHIFGDKILGKLFDEIIEEDCLADRGDKNVWLTREGQEFVNGWLEAVKAFWEKISLKLDN